jgi:hypothetical protein|tara:strand:- start:663 stop:890 length:228 start_codon:yes stop_codon:yes gene_type:complete
MAKVSKKRTSVQSITLKHISEKLDHLHKDLDQNSKDIVELKQQVAMGKGGLKVIFWLGAVVGLILTSLKISKDFL